MRKFQANIEKIQQLSSDQLKKREVAELYLKIQENTQFLTHVVRYNNLISKSPLWLNKPVDLRSIVHIIIQQSYLLYSCFLKKINIFISVELYTRPKDQLSLLQQAFCEYMLEIDLNRHSQSEQKKYLFRLQNINLNSSPYRYGEYLCGIIRHFRTIMKSQLEKAMRGGQNAYARQIFNLSHIVENIIFPQIKELSAQAIILILEETQAFREQCLLVKCLNNSLFAAIHYHPKSKEIYQQLIEVETTISPKYHKKNPQLYKKIEQLIQKSFKLLMLRFNIVYSQVSLRSKNGKNEITDEEKVKPYQLGQIEGDCPKTRKYILGVFVKEKLMQKITGDFIKKIIARIKNQPIKTEQVEQNSLTYLEGLNSQQKASKGEFLIEYFSSTNLICLRHITNLELNIENSDILLFYCNYFTTSWNGISMQFVQKKSSKSKKNERYLCFKLNYYVNIQERIIFNILIMIDMLMMHYKILEPQIRKDIVNFDKDTNSISVLACKCEHMRNIFVKKIEKNYRFIYQSLTNLNS